MVCVCIFCVILSFFETILLLKCERVNLFFPSIYEKMRIYEKECTYNGKIDKKNFLEIKVVCVTSLITLLDEKREK